MNVSILTIADPGYLKRAARIIELYNAHSMHNESPQLQKPSSTLIIAVEGDSGGLLLDHCSDDEGKYSFYRIMFAAFEPEHRRQGFLKSCLAHAEAQGLDIRFVELNVFDDSEEAWAKVGFKHLGTWGFTIVASREIEPFIHYGVSSYSAPREAKKEDAQ